MASRLWSGRTSTTLLSEVISINSNQPIVEAFQTLVSKHRDKAHLNECYRHKCMLPPIESVWDSPSESINQCILAPCFSMVGVSTTALHSSSQCSNVWCSFQTTFYRPLFGTRHRTATPAICASRPTMLMCRTMCHAPCATNYAPCTMHYVPCAMRSYMHITKLQHQCTVE